MIKKITDYLPEYVKELIKAKECPTEVRLRKNRNVILIYPNRNIELDYSLSEYEFENTLQRLTHRSIHSYSDYIKKGFFPFEDGSRIGIAGTAVCDENNIINIKDITSLNIRIASDIPIIPTDIFENEVFNKSLLIYSPPNYGKTTLLRYFASTLSNKPYSKNVCVCDSRGEITGNRNNDNFNGDCLLYYPKNKALEIALRCMSPDVIITDEIGLIEDTEIICECALSGVKLICTAHGKTISEITERKNIRYLHDKKIFEGYIEISISNGIRNYKYIPREKIIC